MNRKLISMLVSIFVIFVLVLSGCSSEDATSTTSNTSSASKTMTTNAASTTAVQTTSSSSSDWWDEFGEPQYGGTITIRNDQLNSVSFDPLFPMGSTFQIWMEPLTFYDWTVDREEMSFTSTFIPEVYYQGNLIESWELSDPTTVTVKLRQGIKFQDLEPANGRELVADDIVYHYDRLLGTGHGFTQGNAFLVSMMPNLKQVTAEDDYTLNFELKTANPMGLYDVINGQNAIAAPEALDAYGTDSNDIRNAVGTGAWIVTEFVSGVSLEFVKNENYWGYDERYPENQLPYADSIKVLAIPDLSTSMAAMRTGKVDIIATQRGGPSLQDVKNLTNTNPDINIGLWSVEGSSIDFRVDTAPFNDIKVRQALEMSIDREAIAQTIYLGYVDGTPCGLLPPEWVGYCVPYDEWDTELQDYYSYNPDRAIELLTEAGYPDGFDTSCIASSADNMEVLEIIKAYFQQVGVTMNIESYDNATFQSIVASGDTTALTYYPSTGMQWGTVANLNFRSSSEPRNTTHNNDATYEEMVSKINAASSLDEAKQLISDCDMYAINQFWSVNLFPLKTPVVWQSYLKGYSGEHLANPSMRGEVMSRLWIDQDLKESLGN